MGQPAWRPASLFRPAATGGSGFTLLELMIAFAIMGLVTLTLFFSFRMALNSYQKGQDRITEEAYNRVLEDQIRRQIGSLFPLRPAASLTGMQQQQAANPDENMLLLSQTPLFYGTSDSVTFITVAPLLLLENPGLTVVRYGLAEDEKSRRYLGAMETRYLGFDTFKQMTDVPRGEPLPLVKDVEEVRFEYYGYDQQAQTYNWYDTWNAAETMAVPHAIRIHADEKVITVPVNAVFNQAMGAAGGGGIF